MERGVGEATGPASGWIGRHLATLENGNSSPLRAIGLGAQVQRSLQGAVPAAALRSITDFHLGGDPRAAARFRAALATLYAGDAPLDAKGRETLELLDTLDTLDPATYRPGHEARYPASDFGMALKQVAMLVKAEVGLEVACVDVGGWDTHIAQGGVEGAMAALLRDLAAGLAALHADLLDQADRLLVVTLSEFGRRAAENGGRGTDHGHGECDVADGRWGGRGGGCMGSGRGWRGNNWWGRGIWR
ncbi:MAG: DUF1501 domain-containing protein [Thermomicrobiales bacterium]